FGQSCHWRGPSTGLLGALSDASPDRRWFMESTSSSLTLSVVAICLTCSGCRLPSSSAAIWPLSRRRLKNRRFWAAVVPILTSDQDRRTYSWIDALIHHMA